MMFGIFPSGASATDPVSPDDPDRTEHALTMLTSGTRCPFRIRVYAEYHGAPCDQTADHLTPPAFARHVHGRRRLDLVVQFQSEQGDVDGFAEHIRRLVNSHGHLLDTLQVTEEANVTGGYGLDGDFPRVREALVAGVLAAHDAAEGLSDAEIRVGFNVTPPAHGDDFFARVGELGGRRWTAAVDFVGLDCFPDVWDHPVADDGSPGDAGDAMVEAVRWLRDVEMPAAGLGAGVPIIVTEHGWPTGPGRSPRRQASVLERVVRALHAHRVELNVTGYTHFALRDADSAGDDLFDQFGLMWDDYTPKPAFETYRRLIAELGDPESHHR
ncbi:hypothetical protein G1H10_22135 [Phytoactinopolyspora halotolerans]|uniref:Arabinogalactan endo-beta-1,4-galactanase n=1 Tax=Phytoactinopolyspora halotolerans TaxID=1981512 RepID=A0A6L9SCR2_9ACTN|nr:hypothetical protein [Phytoactinopolyspora halotolerans]